MLATEGTVGAFWLAARSPNSCPCEAARSLHVEFLSSSVAGQILFVDADPQQHPMERFQRTLETGGVFEERADQLWHSRTGTQTAKTFSNKCHFLHTTVVKRYPGKYVLEEHDAARVCAGQADQNADEPMKQTVLKDELPDASTADRMQQEGEVKPSAKFLPNHAEEVPGSIIAQETSGQVASTYQPNICACLAAIGSSGQDGCSQPSLGPTDPHPKASVCPPAGPAAPKVWLAQEPSQLQSSPAPTAFLERQGRSLRTNG